MGFATAALDDSFRLAGVLAPVTTFDPVASGLSIELSNRYFGSFVSADVPGGIRWRARPRGAASFFDADGTHGGVTRIKLKPLADGTMAVAITGRRQSYASNDIRPFKVAIGLAGAGCAEAFLSPPACNLPTLGNTMRCVPPRPQKLCGDDPDARVRCDAVNAAAAQESYYASHGEFLSGECAELPGFTSSPDTLCVMSGNELNFALVTVGTSSTIVCVYDSFARPGDPNLVCS